MVLLPRVAVLVDADNVPAEQIDFAVAGAARHGAVVLRRAFGRLSSINGRAEALAAHGFVAEIALPPPGSGKNAADLMLAQYATRLAERRVVEIVALVSSDGDFAPIATGLAEAGIRTLGFGRQDTPAALRNACAQFVCFPAPLAAAPLAAIKAAAARPGAVAAAALPPAAPPAAPSPAEIGLAATGAVPQKNLSGADRARLISIVEGAMAGNRVHLSEIGKRLNATFGGNYKAHFGGMRVSEIVKCLEGYMVDGAGAHKTWLVRLSPGRVVSLAARPAATG